MRTHQARKEIKVQALATRMETLPVGPYILENVGKSGTDGHHPRTVDGLTVRPAGPWFMTEKFPRTQSENLAKSRLTDRPTVHGLFPWIETSLTQPLTQTTVDQHGPSFDPRSIGLTVDEGQQPVS
ncbi:hypothetical protein MTR67_027123 [Solanum verrucosum]|uniref:Late blight resistance protein n=1 Tax=Solanum verrucosum TaxID=315347 RepID=A0AAF0R460_SOLVR|nr:hypothetical protein MTR67_027123 [Solanum verrucosum]